MLALCGELAKQTIPVVAVNFVMAVWCANRGIDT